VVKKLVFMVYVLAALAAGCSDDNKQPQQDTQSAPANVTTEDIEKAQELPVAEQKISVVKYAPAKGDRFSYKVVQYEEVQEDSLKVIQKIESFYTKNIVAIRSGGSIEMTVRIDSLFVSNTMPDPTQSNKPIVKTYNSRNKKDRENPDLRDFTSILDEDIRIILDSKGRVEEIGGLTPIVNKILGDKRDSVSPDIKSRITTGLESQVFRLTIASEIIPFPDSPIDSTLSWTRQEVNPLSGLFRSTSRSTYKIASVKKVGDKRVGIIKAQLSAEVLKPKESNGVVEMSLSSSSIGGDGEMMIDLDKGYTISKKTQVLSDLNGAVKEIKTKQERKIHQKTLTKISVELLP
jgi:hypothetical protein